MTIKLFNIGDTVLNKEGIKGKIIKIFIDEFGVKYEVKHCSENLISLEYADELIKAPITREEALAAALKDISKRISQRIDVEISEFRDHFEVWSREHNGVYIPMSKEEYEFEK